MTLMAMTIKSANDLYNRLIRQYGMKESWFNEGWHIKMPTCLLVTGTLKF